MHVYTNIVSKKKIKICLDNLIVLPKKCNTCWVNDCNHVNIPIIEDGYSLLIIY